VPDELLTVNEVAELLKLNQQTIRNMIDRGELGHVRIGQRRVRVRQSQLGARCQTPLPETRENGSQIRGRESRSAPLQRTSATNLVRENADFGRAGRDAAKNTTLLDAFLAAGEPSPKPAEADPWQQVSEAANSVAAAVRAQDRDALDRAISTLRDAAQEIRSVTSE
jgi:excisionase family DNA binding protein